MPQRRAIDAQQVRPLQRPEVGELRPPQQFLDQPGAAVGPLVGQEAPRLGGRRQRADHVEIDAAQILGVVGQFRGQDVQLAQLAKHQAIDEVVLGHGRIVLDAFGARHEDAEGIHGVHEAGHDGRLAGRLAGHDQAARLHRGQAVVVRLKLGVGGHVDLAAVGVAGDDAQLLPAAQGEDALARLDADRRHDSDRRASPNGRPAAIQARTVS